MQKILQIHLLVPALCSGLYIFATIELFSSALWRSFLRILHPILTPASLKSAWFLDEVVKQVKRYADGLGDYGDDISFGTRCAKLKNPSHERAWTKAIVIGYQKHVAHG